MNSIIKNKKALTLFLASSLLAISLAGCGNNEEEPIPLPTVVTAPISTPAPEATATPTEEPISADMLNGIPIIGEREIVDGKMQSYLTGEWKDVDVASRRPIAVMIPNNKPALPHYGVSQASIIYEATVEGRITRLMPIFEDFDDLNHIGPVRSSRDYYIYAALSFDAIYCNWGQADLYVGDLINSDRVDNISNTISGIDDPSPKAFDRITRSGYATEFTGYLFIDGLKQEVDDHGYRWNYAADHVPPMAFAAENARAEYADEEDAVMIYPGGKSSNKGGYGQYNPYFEYNDEDYLYYRYQDGKAMIDEMNNEHYAVSNVIFQYCHGEVRDAKDYLAFRVHGEGDALIFTNGKVIEATWERPTDNDPTKYYDTDGNEIVFNQGKTWICNIWEEYGEHVLYE